MKAVAYSHARYVLDFAGFGLSIVIYFLLWRGRVAVMFRDWARALSSRRLVQSLFFATPFFAVVGLLQFPLDYLSDFVLEHWFGLSTQSFASWLGDWGKNLGISAALGVFLVWIFFRIARRSPRRWWVYFWLATIPITLAILLVEPYVVEPLFFNFTRLDRTRPALAGRVEEMLHHASLEIPPSRIFEMEASTKTRALNAYVSGLGASKRVVVWDTTLQKMDQDEVLLVLGHETGHYILRHIPKVFALIELIVLALLRIGFSLLKWAVERFGSATGVESVTDLASLPLALLVLTFFWFMASPLINAISRHYEHEADQFGLELAYGVVPDPNGAEVRSLQQLGEEDLADPNPPPFVKFWLYTHPPLDDRIRFAAAYKPWAEGKPLKLISPGP